MKAMGIRALAVMSGLGLLAGPALAQTVSGTAYGASVDASGVTAQSPVATLSSSGGYATGSSETFTVSSLLDARWLEVVTTGAAENKKSGAQSVSEIENVSVLSGVIQAELVTAVASSYVTDAAVGSSAAGSGFVNLVVNGVAITTDVAPNTRVTLPGVGYAILNEQVSSGDGASSSGLRVTMIRVVLQDALTGATTGEIVVGAASSSAAL